MLDAVLSAVGVPEADGTEASSSLPGLLGEGLSPGLSVGLSVGFCGGGGVVAALALVTVTVTGAPGPALNVLDGL